MGEPATVRAGAAPAQLGTLVTLLALCVLVIVTTLSMLGPLLVDLSADLGVSLGQVGLLAAATSLPAAAAALVAGPLSDRFGRPRLIVGALTGLGLATVLAAGATGFEVMLGLRVLAGTAGGFGPTALMAIVGDRAPRERLGWAMGWMYSGFGLAAVAGVPLVAALAGHLGWRAAFLGVGALLLLVAPVVRWYLGRGAPAARPAPRGGHALAGYRAVLQTAGQAPLLQANMSERVAFNAGGLYLAAFIQQQYGVTTAEVAPVLAATALGAIAGNALGGRLTDRVERSVVYAAGQLGSVALALALFLVPAGVVASAALAAGFGLANAVSRPAVLAMGSDLAPAHRGTALGLLSASNQLGWSIGAALGGLALAAGWSGVAALAAAAALLAAISIRPWQRRRAAPAGPL